MASRIYIAIFLILHSQISFAISLQTPVVKAPQLRDPRKKPKKNAIEYLIRSIRPPEWADFNINGEKKNGEGDGGTGDGNDSSSDGFGDGAGGSGSGGGKGNAGKGNLGMNENAKGNPPADPGEKDPPARPPGSPPEKEPPGQQGEAYSKWFPTCVFIDAGINGNNQVKRIVDMAAFCKVNIEIYAFTINPTSYNASSSSDILSKQKSSCNILDTGKATKASTLVVTEQNDIVADEMCGLIWKNGDPKQGRETKVAGCNELASGGGGNAEVLKQQRGGAGDGLGQEAQGGLSAGIVDKGGVGSGNVWSHETHGHGEMGLPNGKKAGNGIGFGEDPDDTDDGGESGNGNYTQAGCARMRSMALPNDGTHKYFPSREKYYVENTNPNGQLKLGTPVWGKGQPPTPPSEPPQSQPPLVTSRELPPGEKPSGTREDKSGDLVLANTPGGGHKKPKLTGPTSTPKKIPDSKSNPIAAGTAPGDANQDPTPIQRDESIDDKKPSANIEVQKGGPIATIRMDENAQANTASVGSLGPPSEGGSAPSGGEASSGNVGGIRMNEDATGREGAVSLEMRGSGSVGYDAIAGIDADSADFTNGLSSDFFKNKKPKLKERVLKRGEALRRGGGSLRRPASVGDATKIYQDGG